MADKIRKQDRKGEAIDCLNRLRVEMFKSPQNLKDFETLDEIIRDNLEGCEWSHDRMLTSEGYMGHHLTEEQHLGSCGCDCPFCESEHDRLGAKPR